MANVLISSKSDEGVLHLIYWNIRNFLRKDLALIKEKEPFDPFNAFLFKIAFKKPHLKKLSGVCLPQILYMSVRYGEKYFMWKYI